MNSIKLNRMHQSLLSLGVLVIGCFIGWNWVLPADDALITQRYVLNYLEYGEPYFNRNDGVMGFSSPAYFLILSALSWVFSVEVAYKLIASLSYIATGVILFLLLPHSAGSKKIWFLVIFSGNLHILYWFFSGLESFFIPLFALLTVLAVTKRSGPLLIFVLSISIFFRPESWIALLPIMLVGVYSTIRQHSEQTWQLSKRNLTVTSAVSFGIATSIIVFIITQFDNLIPMSVQAKSVVPYTLTSDIIEEFAAEIIAPLNLPIPFGYVFGIGVFALIGVANYTRFRTIDQLPLMRIVIVSGLLFALYLLLSGASIYEWHYAFISVVAVYALIGFAQSLSNKGKIIQIPVLILVIFSLAWSGFEYGTSKNQRINDFYIDQMQVVGEFISKNYEKDLIVVSSSTGYFGAVTRDFEVHDSLGLVTPELIDARKKNPNAKIVEVIDWDLFLCSSSTTSDDALADCLINTEDGKLVQNFGNMWLIERKY